MKFQVLEPNYGGLRAKPPASGGDRGSGGGAPSFLAIFIVFLIKILQFEAYLSLDFYKNVFDRLILQGMLWR